MALIRHLKKRAYEVHLFFLWIPTVRLALTRVRTRILQGGHDVPESVVRRRFDRSIRNFLQHYRAPGDSWMLLDNSGTPPILIAFEERVKPRVIDRELYENLTAHWGKQ